MTAEAEDVVAVAVRVDWAPTAAIALATARTCSSMLSDRVHTPETDSSTTDTQDRLSQGGERNGEREREELGPESGRRVADNPLARGRRVALIAADRVK